MNIIKQSRKRLGLSHMELALEIGVSLSCVQRWENGECCPNLKYVPQIVSTLGCTVDDLVREVMNAGGDSDK